MRAFLRAVALLAALVPGATEAADLAGIVRDGAGAPVADAVLYAVPRAAPLPPIATPTPPPTAIDQVNSQFPFIKPIRRGSSVVFRNADTYGHTVYSVSQTKVFNIPLSRDVVSAPVVFDTAGVVGVGCSIHDYMLAYILVLDTPYFAVTNATGTAVLHNLPADTHDVFVWHPGMAGAAQPQPVAVTEGAIANAEFRLALKLDGLWRIDRNNPVGRHLTP
jgi:hypothetical protein